jgi:naringenin degradation protein FdeH
MTRRVVTGHRNGKAIVLHDGAAPNRKVRPGTGLVSTLLWVTDESPADIAGNADRAAREIGIAPPGRGSIFRVVDFPPGCEPFMHRTRSIDYAVVLEGEIDMLVDDSEVHLCTGDVLIQQGTNHGWTNRGKNACRIAFVLIGAEDIPA